MTRAECFRELELEPSASPDEIRQAWRDLAQVWHPDRFPNNERLQQKAQERLKRINEAYRALQAGGAGPSATQPEPRYRPEAYESREAAPDPLESLKDGPLAWNLWRNKWSNITPSLGAIDLTGRALEGIDFRECRMAGADLSEADLYKANLSQADFTGAKFEAATLHRALLLETKLVGADLRRADLASADLRGASLIGARFDGAQLIGVRLEGADLTDATGLTLQQLETAEIDDATVLPRKLA